METLFRTLQLFHIAGGAIGLLAGSYNMVTKKGTRLHRQIGLIFFYAMLLSAMVALPMSYLHHNYFLLIVGVFTTYLLLTGKRYLLKKTIPAVSGIDWALWIMMLLFGSGFIVWGIMLLTKGNGFGTVLMVFGSLGYLFLVQDYKCFTGKSRIKNFWLTNHIQRMTGAYIASFTAFIVVNNKILPGVFAWLLPTFILVPILLRWSFRHQVLVEKKQAA